MTLSNLDFPALIIAAIGTIFLSPNISRLFIKYSYLINPDKFPIKFYLKAN